MRTYVAMDMIVSDDDNQVEKLFERLGFGFDDNDDTRNEVIEAKRVTLAAAATDIAVNFGGVSAASTMLILADADISVKMNGGATAMQVLTTPAAIAGSLLSDLQRYTRPGIVFWRGNITALTLTNLSSTETASVLVVLVGNQT